MGSKNLFHILQKRQFKLENEKTVRLFDFDNPENNDFLVTNQFQLEGLKQPIFPDIVIFVNGIPLVLIECKSPYIKDPIVEAVEKNFERYQSRGSGYERLMFYNHFLVATCGNLARHGTVGASVNHYARWSEAYPLTEQDIEKMCGFTPREQEILIAGMLSKSHILDLLKNYVIYEVQNNKKIKKLAKHQQYRVVTKAVERIDLAKDDIADKGGVIWHTQGSGKSLSMLWLATQLMYKLGNPPIVIVTDRKQLDEQIHGTFKDCGFPDPIATRSRNHLQELLSNPRGKTIMTTIQKFGSKERLAGYPSQYKLFFVTGATYFLNPQGDAKIIKSGNSNICGLLDVTNLVSAPPPEFNIFFSPSSLELRSAPWLNKTEKDVQLKIQSRTNLDSTAKFSLAHNKNGINAYFIPTELSLPPNDTSSTTLRVIADNQVKPSDLAVITSITFPRNFTADIDQKYAFDSNNITSITKNSTLGLSMLRHWMPLITCRWLLIGYLL